MLLKQMQQSAGPPSASMLRSVHVRAAKGMQAARARHGARCAHTENLSQRHSSSSSSAVLRALRRLLPTRLRASCAQSCAGLDASAQTKESLVSKIRFGDVKRQYGRCFTSQFDLLAAIPACPARFSSRIDAQLLSMINLMHFFDDVQTYMWFVGGAGLLEGAKSVLLSLMADFYVCVYELWICKPCVDS
jgi:hypothetical protein